MYFKETILIWLKWFHKKLARRYKEVVSIFFFFHYTLKSSKQKEDPEKNLNLAFFYIKTSL